MGSGKFLRRAIRKHGIDNFTKEILEVYDSEKEMNLAEKILVVVDTEVSYNLCPGGLGGWGYLNDGSEQHRKRASQAAIKSNSSEKSRKALETRRKQGWKPKVNPASRVAFLGKKHSPETIELIRLARKGKFTGEENSQFGTIWITDGTQNKKIKKEGPIPQGWKRGRTTN